MESSRYMDYDYDNECIIGFNDDSEDHFMMFAQAPSDQKLMPLQLSVELVGDRWFKSSRSRNARRRRHNNMNNNNNNNNRKNQKNVAVVGGDAIVENKLMIKDNNNSNNSNNVSSASSSSTKKTNELFGQTQYTNFGVTTPAGIAPIRMAGGAPLMHPSKQAMAFGFPANVTAHANAHTHGLAPVMEPTMDKTPSPTSPQNKVYQFPVHSHSYAYAYAHAAHGHGHGPQTVAITGGEAVLRDTFDKRATDERLQVMPTGDATVGKSESVFREDIFNGELYETHGVQIIDNTFSWHFMLHHDSSMIVGVIDADIIGKQKMVIFFDTNSEQIMMNLFGGPQAASCTRVVRVKYYPHLGHLVIKNVTVGSPMFGQQLICSQKMDTTRRYKLTMLLDRPGMITMY